MSMEKDSVKQIWQDFRKQNLDTPNEYVAWAFGDSKEMANTLARLVLEGKKTATASNYALYELHHEELPKVGLINILLDGDEEAVAILRTTAVDVIPFDQVTETHAYLEGEGDRSLAYWRNVHEEFFTKELDAIGREFHQQMPVVCERFEVIFKR